MGSDEESYFKYSFSGGRYDQYFEGQVGGRNRDHFVLGRFRGRFFALLFLGLEAGTVDMVIMPDCLFCVVNAKRRMAA
jgi:hypothetical protein